MHWWQLSAGDHREEIVPLSYQGLKNVTVHRRDGQRYVQGLTLLEQWKAGPNLLCSETFVKILFSLTHG